MANQPKKYKKFVATAATATLVASAIVPVASAASLSDIAGNTHEEAINALVDAKVISGYPDGTFKPNKTLTRSDVVKLLGKYLETQGFEPAGNYKTSPAFKDLKTTSNEELLKYASVVKEAGVFAGSNGNLLAGDSITRENMAIVLVRMINTLKDVSLEEYVASQDFDGDVTDLEQAKAEARTAIAVLDFYDITNPAAPVFNPKGDTTRGQFASFLNKTINADYAGASATTGTVKAINNTTVEVTFGEKVEDIKDLNFTIEGLEVKNAVVKLTDNKTVVVTTTAQTAGKEYEVKVNGNAVGKFTGVSAVLPKSVKMITNSQQAVYGQQVTVKAEVTVEDGQSKAGIPLTFIIAGNGVNATPSYIEVTTDANGVAQHTYTQYTGSEDTVTVYATAKADIRNSAAKVYWANAALLTVTEVTEGNTLVNGSKKIYKVKARSWATDANGNKYVNVAFKENIDVAPNKVVTDVEVIDRSSGSAYPYQYSTTSTMQQTRVYLNSDNEATFTLDGADAAVTPIVFVDSSTTQSGRYVNTYLQQAVPTVTFAATQLFSLDVTSVGQLEQSAAIDASGTGQGGRNYKAVVKDKDGKVVPNARVQIAFKAENITKNYTNGQVKVVDTVGNVSDVTFASATSAHSNYITLQANAKGEVDFRVIGYLNNWAIPTVVIDNGSTSGALDKADVQNDGPLVHFVQAIVEKSSLTVKNGPKESLSFGRGEVAEFTYSTADQNGNPYYTGAYLAKFEITAGNDDLEYSYDGTNWNTTTQKVDAGRKATLTVNSTNGEAKIYVRSAGNNIATTATVNASASQGVKVLPNITKVASFSPYTAAASFTGTATQANVNFTAETITLAGGGSTTYTAPLNPTGAIYKEKTATNTYATINYARFLEVLNNATVTIERDVNGVYTYIIEDAGTEVLPPTAGTPGSTIVTLASAEWTTNAAPAVTTPATFAQATIDTTDLDVDTSAVYEVETAGATADIVILLDDAVTATFDFDAADLAAELERVRTALDASTNYDVTVEGSNLVITSVLEGAAANANTDAVNVDSVDQTPVTDAIEASEVELFGTTVSYDGNATNLAAALNTANPNYKAEVSGTDVVVKALTAGSSFNNALALTVDNVAEPITGGADAVTASAVDGVLELTFSDNVTVPTSLAITTDAGTFTVASGSVTVAGDTLTITVPQANAVSAATTITGISGVQYTTTNTAGDTVTKQVANPTTAITIAP